MNDAEKRRRQLLEQTRERYSDRRIPPAIHPRYGSAYRTLYGRDEDGAISGTFGIRVFLCSLILAAFITMDYKQMTYKTVTSDWIVQEITTDMEMDIGRK